MFTLPQAKICKCVKSLGTWCYQSRVLNTTIKSQHVASRQILYSRIKLYQPVVSNFVDSAIATLHKKKFCFHAAEQHTGE